MNKHVKSHDALVKKAMSRPMVAKEFFSSYLPKAILDKIDIQTLKKKNSVFLSNVLGAGSTDILFTVEMKDSVGYLSLLLEHQSKPDEKIAFRIQKYMLQLCDASTEARSRH